MAGKLFFRTGLFAAVLFAAQISTAATANEAHRSDSARLTRLVQEVRAGNRQALATFWQEINGKLPLIESIDKDPSRRRITFIWRGSNDTTRVTMMGGLPAANLLKPLTRLADTDLWFLTEVHSTHA